MSKQKKREKKAQRLKELEALIKADGMRVNLQQYSSAHFRLFGPTVVDYWPGSGRCWVTGSSEKSTKMTPAEVLIAALTIPLPPDASDHLKAIARET